MKLVPDRFIKSKMIKKLFLALHADGNVLYFNEDFGNVVFNCNGMGILNVDLNNINLDNNLTKITLALLFFRFLAWHIKFKKPKEVKKG